MTKYLISAAAAAIVAATFSAPASAQGLSVQVGGDRPYYGDSYRPHRYSEPGVRVYSGRSSVRECRTERTTVYRHGKKIIREKEICD